MELNLSVPLFILKGCGKIPFPSALKREPLKSQIGCESLYLGENERAVDEPCFIICSGSIYRSQDNEVKNNMLGMFVKKKTTNLVTFSETVPINRPQEILEVEIVDFHGKRQEDISCIGLFRIKGTVAQKLLAI